MRKSGAVVTSIWTMRAMLITDYNRLTRPQKINLESYWLAYMELSAEEQAKIAEYCYILSLKVPRLSISGAFEVIGKMGMIIIDKRDQFHILNIRLGLVSK